MEQRELEELSRRAALLLVGSMRTFGQSSDGDVIGQNKIGTWLHESTEACTEIMVRVLNQKGIQVTILWDGGYLGYRSVNWGGAVSCTRAKDVPDPLLAFRVAVLRALVALKAPT